MREMGVAHREDRLAIENLLASEGLQVNDIDDAMLADFLLVRDNGRIKGVVGLQRTGTKALLRSLAVDADTRGRGLGMMLLFAAEMHARTLGINELFLLTTTAVAFFEQMHYHSIPRDEAPREIQQTAQFSALCPSSAIFMAKSLN